MNIVLTLIMLCNNVVIELISSTLNFVMEVGGHVPLGPALRLVDYCRHFLRLSVFSCKQL